MSERLQEISLGIVQNKSNEVLIIQRVKEEKGKNEVKLSWAFPGGRVEDETKEHAVEREVFEETGYKVRSGQVISARQHPQFPVYINYLECILENDRQVNTPHDQEIKRVVWVSPIELHNYFSTDLDKKVAKHLGL